MADIYGGRYKNLGSIRGGAQGDIFRVRDLNSPTGEEFALKRLRDNSRCDRFLREIEAVRALDHPNVVKILDHSGAPDSDHPKHKYWFTMPIAAEGNLEARAGLYEGNLDGVLKVAAQLTEALRIAHEKGIVHRDVKPANILFPKKDHEAWLSDFGICHYAAAGDGLTDAGDVMGPRGFTAPELEHGNSAAVTPAADLYSLGKVIFYMISGGRSVAREHLDLIEFTSVFARGERFGLLRALLTRLIAPFDQRIQTATEVSRELDYIAEWDQRARELALSPDALAAVDAARGAAAKQKAANERGAAAMKTRESQITLAQNGIVTWLRSQLKLVAAYLEKGDAYSVQIEGASFGVNQEFRVPVADRGSSLGSAYVGMGGVQIAFSLKDTRVPSKFVLKFFPVVKRTWVVQKPNAEPSVPQNEPTIGVIPYLEENATGDIYGRGCRTLMAGFLRSKSAIARANAQRPAVRLRHEPLLSAQFLNSDLNLAALFHVSEWPAAVDRLQAMYSEAVETALAFSNSDPRVVGP